jgi:hypothetical protein
LHPNRFQRSKNKCHPELVSGPHHALTPCIYADTFRLMHSSPASTPIPFTTYIYANELRPCIQTVSNDPKINVIPNLFRDPIMHSRPASTPMHSRPASTPMHSRSHPASPLSQVRHCEYPTGCPGKNWDDGLEFNDKQKKTPSSRGTKRPPNYANQHPNHVRSRNATCTAFGKSVTRSRNTPKITR